MRRGADIVYMTRDGQYAFTGDLYQVPSHDNLTEVHRRELRRKLIDAVPESQMVVFSPPQPKYTVTVFTDVDCAYCRELHRQIADYNRLGVRVRYVFYPRTGPEHRVLAQGGAGVVLGRPQGRADASQARRAAGRQAVRAIRRSRRNMSSARPSVWRARRGSSPPTAPWWAATCRPMRWSKQLKQLQP